MIEFEVLARELLAWELQAWELLALELESQTLKTLLLILGAGISVWGLVLIRSHRVEFDLPKKELSRQEEGFARRKFYRRMTGSSLITCVGMCLAAMYWASHPKVFFFVDAGHTLFVGVVVSGCRFRSVQCRHSGHRRPAKRTS